MNTRNLILTASFIALLVQGASAASPSTPDKVTTGFNLAAVSPQNPESALKQAMPADTVRQIMGQPDEIKPMKAPSGKAEIWVYTRKINECVEQVEIGSVPVTVTVTGLDGKLTQQTISEKIQYRDLHRYAEETVELLIFNDHYLTHKISRRELKSYS